MQDASRKRDALFAPASRKKVYWQKWSGMLNFNESLYYKI